VNAVAPEPLEGFESKLTQMFPIVGADHKLIRFSQTTFSRYGRKQRRHTHRRFSVYFSVVSIETGSVKLFVNILFYDDSTKCLSVPVANGNNTACEAN